MTTFYIKQNSVSESLRKEVEAREKRFWEAAKRFWSAGPDECDPETRKTCIAHCDAGIERCIDILRSLPSAKGAPGKEYTLDITR